MKNKYILCTRSKSQHRKAIEVCHKCPHRKHCDDYLQVRQSDQKLDQQPELIHSLNALLMYFNRNNIPREDLVYFKKELEELAALFQR